MMKARLKRLISLLLMAAAMAVILVLLPEQPDGFIEMDHTADPAWQAIK